MQICLDLFCICRCQVLISSMRPTRTACNIDFTSCESKQRLLWQLCWPTDFGALVYLMCQRAATEVKQFLILKAYCLSVRQALSTAEPFHSICPQVLHTTTPADSRPKAKRADGKRSHLPWFGPARQKGYLVNMPTKHAKLGTRSGWLQL